MHLGKNTTQAVIYMLLHTTPKDSNEAPSRICIEPDLDGHQKRSINVRRASRARHLNFRRDGQLK